MRKALTTGLVLALIVGAFMVPAEAAKKKKKKKAPAPVAVDVTYYLRNTADSGCAAESLQLLLEAGDAGGSCGSALSGALNEALISTGDVPGSITYTAAEGIPFVLDASKPITGKIIVLSYRGHSANPGGLSAGPTHFVMTLMGTNAAGEELALGTFESEYIVNPAQQAYEVEFEIETPAELDKTEVTSLVADLYNRGFAPLHGFYQVNTSTIVVPTLQPAE